MTAAEQRPTPNALNRRMAKVVVWNTRNQPVGVARELLEILGLVEPGGREIVPDDKRNLTVDPGSDDDARAPKGPLHVREPKTSSAPPGLYAVPDRAPTPKTPAKKKAPRPAPPAAVGTAPGPGPAGSSASGHGRAAPGADPQVSPSRSHPGNTGGRGAPDAPAAPPGPARCGTLAGWQQHKDDGTPACPACAERREQRLDYLREHARTQRVQRRQAVDQAAAELAVDVPVTEPPAGRPAELRPQMVPVELDEWFATAQRSPHRAVGRAAARAIGVLLQLRIAMDDLARAERAISKEPTE